MRDQVGHQTTGFNMRVAFPKLNLLSREQCLQSDAEVACLLPGGSFSPAVCLEFTVSWLKLTSHMAIGSEPIWDKKRKGKKKDVLLWHLKCDSLLYRTYLYIPDVSYLHQEPDLLVAVTLSHCHMSRFSIFLLGSNHTLCINLTILYVYLYCATFGWFVPHKCSLSLT